MKNDVQRFLLAHLQGFMMVSDSISDLQCLICNSSLVIICCALKISFWESSSRFLLSRWSAIPKWSLFVVIFYVIKTMTLQCHYKQKNKQFSELKQEVLLVEISTLFANLAEDNNF